MSTVYPASIDGWRTAKRTVVSVGLLLASVLVGILFAIVGLFPFVMGETTTAGIQSIVGMVASELGYLVVGAAFLWRFANGPFLHYRRPSGTELRLAGFAIGAVTLLEGAR